MGRVEVIAEVHINDKSLGVLWKRPYKIDITKAAKPGKNKLVIKITNLWVNRLIGDEQVDSNNSQRNWKIGALDSLPEWYLQLQPKPNDGRITFTAWKYYSKNDALVESGLIGPVTIQTAILKSL